MLILELVHLYISCPLVDYLLFAFDGFAHLNQNILEKFVKAKLSVERHKIAQLAPYYETRSKMNRYIQEAV